VEDEDDVNLKSIEVSGPNNTLLCGKFFLHLTNDMHPMHPEVSKIVLHSIIKKKIHLKK